MVTGKSHFVVPLAGALLLAAPAVVHADSFVTGDSLGQGIAAAAGLPNRAQISVHLSQPAPIEQISTLPRGSVAFMSLGTNDAVGPVANLGPAIDAIVRAARDRGVRLVWIGPPCTTSRRVRNVAPLDAMLRERVRGEGITYVSMVEGEHCSPEMRARDGIHFTPAGYRAVWETARAAAGMPAAPRGGALAVAQSAPVARASLAALPATQLAAVEPRRERRAPAARALEAQPDRAPARRTVALPVGERAVAGQGATQAARSPEARGQQPERAREATGRPRQLTPGIRAVPAPRPVQPAPLPAQSAPSFWPFWRS